MASPTIRPGTGAKTTWDLWVLMLIVYSAIEIPLRLSLGYDLSGGALVFDWVVTISFAIDIILTFFTGHQIKERLITDKSFIAKKYLKTWFTIDFLATVPFDAILSGALAQSTGALRILRLLRLTRLLKLVKFHASTSAWKTGGKVDQSVIRLSFFMFWILLIAHWTSCGWILLDGVAPVEVEGVKTQLPLVDRYIKALYWCVTTLTTVGYGDVTPHTRAQHIYTMIIMLMGVGVYGYIIGNVSSLLSNIDVTKQSYLKKIEQFNAFFKYKGIPQSIQERVKLYYGHIWDNRLAENEMGILRELPISIRTQISLFLNREIIQKVPLFKDASDEFVEQIAMSMHIKVFLPGDFIIRQGEIGDSMYFINRGSVEVISPDGSKVFDTLSEGSFFGEMALVLDQPRNATIRTPDFCDVYELSKDDFDRVLERHPKEAASIREIVAERLKQTTNKK